MANNTIITFPTPGRVSQWLQEATRVLQALQARGPSTGRPTAFVWIGQPYYDETLGKPVYVSDINSSGVVWKDATGAVV